MKVSEQNVGSSYSDALEKSYKYYHGKPCTVCNSTLRRVARCGCYSCETDNRKAYQAGYIQRSPARQLWHHAKARSKSRGFEFNISLQDVEDIWPKDGLCPVFGTPMIPGFGKGRGPKIDSPTLDRLVPSKGYIKGNLAVTSFRANRLRQDETDPEVFRKIADWMERV